MSRLTRKARYYFSPSLLILGGALMLSPGITSTLSYAGNVQQTATLPEGSHALEVTLLTGNGTKANGFVWLKGQLGETVPVELVDGGALLSMTPGENYELKAMLATADGTMVEWSQPFCFQPEDGIMWLYPNGLPYAVYPAESAEASERDLFCLLPDAPHNMEIRTEAADNLLKWDYKQFDSFVPVKYEVYHNDTLVGETLVRESVVSVLDGDNSYVVIAVDEYGERRYGEILTLTLENETTIAGNANSLNGMTDDTDSKFSGIKDTGKVNVYITNEDGTALGLATRETHTRVPSETYYSKTKQLTFYYINNSDIFGREAADSAFIDFIHSAVCAKWGERRYCAKCGYSGTNLEHGYSDHDKTSWSHCFGLFNAPAVNHRHNTGPHTYLTAVDSGVPGGNSYRSAAAYTPTAESMKTNPTYWVMTEVHNVIMDIDVDSDNDGDLESNVKNYAVVEDRDEDKAGTLGKVFCSTGHDRDGNGELDCLENIERITTPESFPLFVDPPSYLYMRDAGIKDLIPLEMKQPGLRPAPNTPDATITFSYNSSHPDGAFLNYIYEDNSYAQGDYRYLLHHACDRLGCGFGKQCVPPGGAIRLWYTYNGKTYFIPNGKALKASIINNATFYIEGVKAATSEAITVAYDVVVFNGASNETIHAEDKVRVTPFQITWEPINRLQDYNSLTNQSGSTSKYMTKYSVLVEPSSIPDSAITWQVKDNVSPEKITLIGREPTHTFLKAGRYNMYIDVYNYFGSSGLISSAPTLQHNSYSSMKIDAVYISAQPTAGIMNGNIVAETNYLLSQAGYELPELSSLIYFDDFNEDFSGWSPAPTLDELSSYFKEKAQFLRENGSISTNQLAVFVVNNLGNISSAAGLASSANKYIVIQRNVSPQIFAHEFFHSMGAADTYYGSIRGLKFVSTDCKSLADWGNGYYPIDTSLEHVVRRLSMLGVVDDTNYILPVDQIHGGTVYGNSWLHGMIKNSQKDIR